MPDTISPLEEPARKWKISINFSERNDKKPNDSKVVWTPNLVRQVKRAFRIVRRDEDGRNCVRRGKRPPLLLTLCSTIDLCTPNTRFKGGLDTQFGQTGEESIWDSSKR
ncbi:uncharacterized protein [Procambarus clarkii]|uniref:uncharacterized protein n=1 Tax=Procambarus clarkii TaxID=6728 RepID=UPI0037435EA2